MCHKEEKPHAEHEGYTFFAGGSKRVWNYGHFFAKNDPRCCGLKDWPVTFPLRRARVVLALPGRPGSRKTASSPIPSPPASCERVPCTGVGETAAVRARRLPPQAQVHGHW